MKFIYTRDAECLQSASVFNFDLYCIVLRTLLLNNIYYISFCYINPTSNNIIGPTFGSESKNNDKFSVQNYLYVIYNMIFLR